MCECTHTHTHTHIFFPKYFREFHHFFFFLNNIFQVLLQLWYALKASQSTIPPLDLVSQIWGLGVSIPKKTFHSFATLELVLFSSFCSQKERHRLSNGLSAFLHPELGHTVATSLKDSRRFWSGWLNWFCQFFSWGLNFFQLKIGRVRIDGLHVIEIY